VAALALAGGGAVGILAIPRAVPAQAATPATLARCTNAQHDLSSFPAAPPTRVVAQGECISASGGDEGAGLWVTVYRNGTVVFSGGDGVGVVTAVYNCQGNEWSDFRAVWSTGQSDEESFPCG
jgi:hypothetical protein